MMEAVYTSETSVYFCEITRYYTAEDSHLQSTDSSRRHWSRVTNFIEHKWDRVSMEALKEDNIRERT
jgi:hypothetical protein